MRICLLLLAHTLDAFIHQNSLIMNKRATLPSTMIVQHDCKWEEVNDKNSASRILSEFFNVQYFSDQRCEIFCIEGLPAASMVYNSTNHLGCPVIDAFYLNKAFLLFFDAGCCMRSALYKRYQGIDIQKAANRNDFIFFGSSFGQIMYNMHTTKFGEII